MRGYEIRVPLAFGLAPAGFALTSGAYGAARRYESALMD